MAVIITNTSYTITNHPHIRYHIRRTFHTTSLSPLHQHRHRRLSATSKPNDYEAEEQRWLREEQRWLREEQRWLREEQRWLREEARWNTERQTLLRQISELSLQIQHLQSELISLREIRANSADFEVTLTKMAALLQDKTSNQIPDFTDSQSNSEFDAPSLSPPFVGSAEGVKTKPLEKPSSSSSSSSSSSWSTSLRVGCEGVEVHAMQEALMKLGFYSGEEDMEFSSFSSGTERAVKTWQASVGVREDGVMTVELLERLFAPLGTQNLSPSASPEKADIPKDAANGAPINVKEVQQTPVKKGSTEVDISENRVFLLGENRWEEPSRLNKGNDKLSGGVKAPSSEPKCLVCRGEGRLLCMECDGTGDANVEEQFLDWVDGGAKCPYCEGLGYSICDICEGKNAA